MKAMVMPGPGAPLELVEREVPTPGPREVLVRVHASSFNYHDLVNLMGLIEGPWPRVPMSDAAGEIVAVGPDVSGWTVGDRIISAFHPAWLDGRPTPATKRDMPGDLSDGWLQQFRLAPASSLIAAPAHLSDVEAATLTCAATTAWSALEEGHVGAGDIVVCQGTGGVSLFALQLAKARGATVILTSSSDDKLKIGESLGADHLVNYATTPDWEREVRRLTDRRGADLVVDVGGGATLGRSVGAVRMDGTVAIVGVLGGFGGAEIPVSVAMLQNVHLVGITVGSVAAHRAMSAAVGAARIQPHISHRLGWDEIAEGSRIMQANEHVGKIAVAIP
ncbi:MAG: NAD(P)-dependent alcohol dehydrogenase [Ilumatobacteraceae bacterium]|nr:NAD(P)-dependent alcohol dehydrogenase [Ilumatobacteraceae bacterium]